jgi:hypothetical protein
MGLLPGALYNRYIQLWGAYVHVDLECKSLSLERCLWL